MKSSIRSAVVMAVFGAAAVVAAVPAQAADDSTSGGRAAFVQTNDPAGNSIATFDRHANGTLTYVASYATGGKGGRATGSASDPLASQGSLTLLPEAGLLIAVNAGSDTISVFQVHGDRLRLDQVLPSGGPFPNSVAVHGSLVYVLDAGGQGFLSGYRLTDGGLRPISGSTRGLGLANATTPFFLAAPAQVGFTQRGDHLVVTTKTNSTVDVFSVGEGGRLGVAAVQNPAPGVPFAFLAAGADGLLLNFAATSSLATVTVNPDGTITSTGAPVSDGQAALCWLTRAGGFVYGSNTGSGSVSEFTATGDNVTLVSSTAAAGVPGAVDSASAGSFLYVQSGSTGTVHAFGIGTGGALTPIQVVSVPGGGSQEGIAVG